jgi:integrase
MSSNAAEQIAANPGFDRHSTLLEDVIETVERRLTVQCAAKRTHLEYREEAEAFGAWFRFASGEAPMLTHLTVATAERYLTDAMQAAQERGRPWAKDTVAHHVRQLRAFAGHAAAACGLPANLLASLAGPAVTKRDGRVGDALEYHETVALFGHLNAGIGRDLVAAGLLALGSEVGPRTSELGRAEVPDFTMAVLDGQILGPVVTIRHPAKNGPVRTLPLGRAAETVIRQVIGTRTDGPLFPSRTGAYLSVDGIRDLVSRAGKRAGIELSPQRLRRSAASWQSAYGASSGHLDTVFGWVPDPGDVKSGHYIKPTVSQLLHAHQERLSPLDRLERKMGRLPFG